MTLNITGLPKDLYIGGEWRPSTDGSRFQVIDPAVETPLCDVASATATDALAAVDAASSALPAWSAKPARDRAEILRKSFEIMMARSDEIATLMVYENGKAYRDALAETKYAAEFLRWYSEEAVRVLGEFSQAPSGSNRILVSQQPVGVALLITPWNFPAAMATRKIGPALAAGCTVILKPASETPLTALMMAQIFQQAGVPKGVVNVIPCNRSSKVIGPILEDARVRKLSFTGSTEIGRLLLTQAAGHITNCSMELGGNAPFVVFADADLKEAVAAAMIAKLRNGGEACTAANRFYVEAEVADEFGMLLTDAMKKVKMGPGLEPGVELGPMVNEETRLKIDELVVDAVGRGAKVTTGGSRPNRRGYFYPPTVLMDVPRDSSCLHEEIFGPVAPIVRFDGGVDEAIKLANNTQYGLVSYVFTSDLKKGLHVADRIDSGMVGLNRGVVSDPAAPFGGMKESGIGREGGHDGLLEYLEKKYVALNW